jgi:putative acetyltransferase
MDIRVITPQDNKAIAEVVRSVMTEFGADPATTILGDPQLDHMFENYQDKDSVYYIVESEGKVVGGAGIKHLDGSKENICELQRMFLLPEARGKGIGRKLMELCITKARDFNYDQIYLESLSSMKEAILLYQMSGFIRINKPMGNTGHGGCNVFMAMNLR